MITDGAETIFIGNPAEGDLLALRADVVSVALVGVAGFVTRSLLSTRFGAAGVIGAGVAD